jgi:aldehyde dehydrogenase (NAD+)
MFYFSGAAMVASIKPYAGELALTDGRMLIAGEWVPARDGATWSHTHPATGERVASFPVAAAADVDLAVRAARQAFERDRGHVPGRANAAG